MPSASGSGWVSLPRRALWGSTHRLCAVCGRPHWALNSPRWSHSVTLCSRNCHTPLLLACSVNRCSARALLPNMPLQRKVMVLPPHSSVACTSVSNWGMGSGLWLVSRTVSTKGRPCTAGWSGTISSASTLPRKYRTSSTSSRVSSRKNPSSPTANGACVSTAAANSSTRPSAQHSLPAMAVGLFRAGTRHGAQQIVDDHIHCLAARLGLVGQHQAVAGHIGKHSGHILRSNKIPPR